MGCMHIILGDRFNEQLQEIYRRALRFLLIEMGEVFDEMSNSPLRRENLDSGLKFAEKDKGNANSKSEFDISDSISNSTTDSGNLMISAEDFKEKLENLQVFAANYHI